MHVNKSRDLSPLHRCADLSSAFSTTGVSICGYVLYAEGKHMGICMIRHDE